MAKLNSFTFTTLNGYFKSPKEDISWHQHNAESAHFSEESLKGNGILLFGRTTYEMMNSFWPTPMAAQLFPKVAEGMNKAQKIVFSKKLKKATWNNTTVIGSDIIKQVRDLKKKSRKSLTILGSGSIVRQLAEAGLIDTYQIMIDPVALGKGTTLFEGMKHNLNLKLKDTRVFKSGAILLTYSNRKNKYSYI